MKNLINRLDDASFHVKLNLIAIVVWAILLIPTVLYWKESIIYLVFMSWYAIFVSHIAAWVAAKAERNTAE